MTKNHKIVNEIALIAGILPNYRLRQIHELLDKEYPEASGDGWLPISSAPKDGTEFLAVNYRNTMYCPIFVRWILRDSYVGWIGRSQLLEHPTHWRPLPPPPAGGPQESK